MEPSKFDAENLQLSVEKLWSSQERLRILEVLRGEDLNLKVGFHYVGPTWQRSF